MSSPLLDDTFAEAFRSYYTRILVTAATKELAAAGATSSAGFATSALGCGVEAGIDSFVPKEKTPDGRPGARIQYHIWKKDPKQMYEVLLHRVGHCILTAPTTAVYDATAKPMDSIDLGLKLKYFGDGFEGKAEVGGREMVVIPIMGGEFMIEKEVGMAKGISGGNLWFMADSSDSAVRAAGRAVAAISRIPGSITPFPGGMCSSGSKVGARKYKFLPNSTNHPYCPTLRGRTDDSKVPEGVESIVEVVVNGISLRAVEKAMKAGIGAALPQKGLIRISAGNFEGKLGKFNINLKDL